MIQSTLLFKHSWVAGILCNKNKSSLKTDFNSTSKYSKNDEYYSDFEG